MKKIIIIGAGISGMTAAMHLINAGFSVEIYESSNKIGGKCFSFNEKLTKKLNKIDNGQHLFATIYSEFFSLMKWLGNEELFSENKGINIDFIDVISNEKTFHYKLNCTKFDNFFGKILGLFQLKGLTFLEKIRFLKIFYFALFLPKNDISVLEFLKKNNQNEKIIKRIWEPIILATLNSPISEASTFLFLNVLKKIFLSNSLKNKGLDKTNFSKLKSSGLIFSKVPISNLFANFKEKFENSGGKIHLNSKINKIIVENNECKGICFSKNSEIIEKKADFVISSVSPNNFLKILENSNILTKKFNNLVNLKTFKNSAIISAYLWLKNPIFDLEFIASVNTKINWIFNINKIQDLQSEFQLISITISHANDLIDKNNSELIEIFSKELKQIFNKKSIEILQYRILKDRKATSLITYKNNGLRLKSKTEIKNFFLAGDWTKTELPATIESASLSGKLASNSIIELK